MHEGLQVLISLSACLVLALVLGLITERLRLSPIVGYLLAGVALGRHTPGMEADPKMASEFAEIGVVLLMFGVGLHFNVKDLLAVRRIAIPGAVGQIAVATSLGALAAVLFGYQIGSGLVFGVAASVASTVVLIRVLMDNNLMDAPEGHIAVGWLIVEDIFTVLVLVVLPVAAGLGGPGGGNLKGLLIAIGMAVLNVALVTVLITVAGRKLIPWMLGHQLISEDGQSLLVASALISISVNPILFRTIEPLERWMRGRKKLWKLISQRSLSRGTEINSEVRARLTKEPEPGEERNRAVVVGYGPVGQTSSRILRELGIETVVIDLNLETVRNLVASGQPAIYGDSTQRDILEAAGIEQARYLLVTVPDLMTRTSVIIMAREMNESLRVFVRARYIQERAWLEEVGATEICTEEAETALGLAVLLLREVGADEARVRCEIERIKRELGVRREDIAR